MNLSIIILLTTEIPTKRFLWQELILEGGEGLIECFNVWSVLFIHEGFYPGMKPLWISQHLAMQQFFFMQCKYVS